MSEGIEELLPFLSEFIWLFTELQLHNEYAQPPSTGPGRTQGYAGSERPASVGRASSAGSTCCVEPVQKYSGIIIRCVYRFL